MNTAGWKQRSKKPTRLGNLIWCLCFVFDAYNLPFFHLDPGLDLCQYSVIRAKKFKIVQELIRIYFNLRLGWCLCFQSKTQKNECETGRDKEKVQVSLKRELKKQEKLGELLIRPRDKGNF